MQSIHRIELDIDGKSFRFETGRMALQAGGSVSVQIGDTMLLSAATAAKEPREGIDYFPLQIEYREKFYAAGRFPGGFFKREARPSEKEVLTARATDRPLRPLFPSSYRNEVQIFNQTLSADGENDPDILSITASSAALTLSEIPFQGPIGAVRIGRVAGAFVVNPTHSEMEQSDLNLVYVGNREFPLMIEGSGQEVSEEDLVKAMRHAHPFVVQLIDAQIALRRMAGLPDKTAGDAGTDLPGDLMDRIRELGGEKLSAALTIGDKQERQAAMAAAREELLSSLLEASPDLEEDVFARLFDALEIETVRSNVLDRGVRVDGRGADELRRLQSEVGLLPRTHGSALFNRGETQALASVTLGTKSDIQSMDAVTGGADAKSFMLHYNFPPFCVGEVRRIMSTSRREIGHGALAEKALQGVLPKDYPYTVRIVSEVMGSNGSSSMASVCAGTLALMDAGVPISKPVAGISIGLFGGESDRAVLVTDILGVEDHCGEMDFKVAGTREGITTFQVDLKIPGLRWDLVSGAFEKARAARLEILDHITGILAEPRAEMSSYAPRIHVMRIDPEKIGALIGPGGKNIRRITDTTGAQIDIEDDGSVHIFSNNAEAMEAAIAEVSAVTAEAEVDKIYHGRVTGIKDFGAFVEILPGKDGLVHISQLADHRVERVEDICKTGDMMWVKCIGVDERGKIRLSRKEAMKEKGLQED